MKIDVNILLIVGDPQWTLDQQLLPRPIQFLNITNIIIVFILLINYVTFLHFKILFKLRTILTKGVNVLSFFGQSTAK
jgi:hypothetical protein